MEALHQRAPLGWNYGLVIRYFLPHLIFLSENIIVLWDRNYLSMICKIQNIIKICPTKRLLFFNKCRFFAQILVEGREGGLSDRGING